MDKERRKQIGFSAIYILVALLGMWLFQQLIFRPLVIRWTEVPYSQFLTQLKEGNIDEVSLSADRIFYTCCEPPEGDRPGQTYNVVPVEDPDLVERLLEAGVTFRGQAPTSNAFTMLLGWIIPFLPLALIGFFVLRRMGSGGPGVMSIGKSKAKEIAGQMTGVTFADVGGVDEVEEELKEIIEFLKDPKRFTRLGAKLPKGVLLVGPPGTGKTLLARAVAGEAGVPFFSISGSDFVEMFVGVGAARVRDLFEQAKAKAPVIIFIDEMDAIGQARTTVGVIGTNDEREQTLNQLLSEMDGFEANQGVVIMAATNRPEILDRALLRPGRFDRQVQVGLPTEEGRRQILEIHTREVILAEDTDLGRVAKITPGFSGADLANIVNEAALLAVRRERRAVSMPDFDLAIERVVAGLQRKMPLRDEVKRKVAYHEGGHALVAQLLPDTDPVHKVSIIPTAKGALGYTMQMPEEDQYLLGQRQLEERMAVMLGGRAAEVLIFDEPSTGAANDLERATELARRMVTEFGMTEALGPVRYAQKAGFGFLNTQTGLRQELGPETAALIDREIRRLVDQAQDQALDLLRTHKTALDEIARVLQEDEVIDGKEIARIAGNRAQSEKSQK
jgi:cell division protease FtsH